VNKLSVVFPDAYSGGVVDEDFYEEWQAFSALKIPCFVIDLNEVVSDFFPYHRFPESIKGTTVVYRGWMLSQGRYQWLQDSVEYHGAMMLTNINQYLNTHYLTNWYDNLRNFTPATAFYPIGTVFSDLQPTVFPEWYKGSCFVRDAVKSNTTTRRSIAHTTHEINDIVNLIDLYKGLEHCICLRQIEPLENKTRYWVVNGRVYSMIGQPKINLNVDWSVIDSPFYSLDIAYNPKLKCNRIVEIGDGQVSGRKGLLASDLAKLLQIMR